ncbi:MAG: TolC family protein [Verrucomicrobia bacterium]|nr:TolC family protein [Verrucomicrobiota bacterium]
MKPKIYTLIALFAAALVRAAEPPPASDAATNRLVVTPAFINQLADELRTNHPGLRAADARALAAGLNVAAVRRWEDPTVSLGGVAATPRGPMLSEEGDLVYGVEQKLPLFGKPQAARRVAEAEAATATANTTYQFQVLRSDFAKTAFAAALADSVVAIGEQDLGWLDTMVATTEQRYRAGDGTLVELLRVQNERAKRAEQLRTDRRLLEHAHFTLNRLLNRELRAPWPRFDLPPVAGPVAYSTQLVNFAMKYEPKIKVMGQEIKQAEALAEATRRSRRPDLSVGVEGRQYSGDAGFREGMLTLSLSLPWVNADKYRSDLKRDQARLKATEFDLAQDELQVREEVHRLTVEIDAARREAILYRDEILRRSQEALASAHAAWIGTRGIFLDLMEARRMFLEAQLMYARSVAEQYQAMSELVLCCGLGDLEALQMIGAQRDLEAPPETKP